MKTLEEKMAALKAQHEKEVKELEVAMKIRQCLPGKEEDWGIFLSTLYGKVAKVTRRTDRHAVDYKGVTPWSPDDLAAAVKALPPLPSAKVSYTFTTFASLPLCEELAGKGPTITELSVPLHVRITGQDTGVAEVTWFANIEGVGQVEVVYPIPWQHKWMRSTWYRQEYRGGFNMRKQGRGRDMLISPAADWSVDWSQGSGEYKADTTLYWTSEKATLEAVLAGIKQAHEGEE